MSEISNAADTLKAKTCCVAGHHEVPAGDVENINAELRREIDRAIEDGYQCFLTNFEDGVCQLFAQAVVEKQSEHDSIRLEAILPYRRRREELLDDEVCKPLLLACADVSFSGELPSADSDSANRREQLRRSSLMILVYDGREGGSTFDAIRRAYSQRISTREIPLGL